MNVTNIDHRLPIVLPHSPTTPQRSSGELQKAGSQFESLLLADVFSKLRESFSLDQDANSDAGHDTLAGLADQALCEGLAAHGGLGLGAMMTRAVAARNR